MMITNTKTIYSDAIDICKKLNIPYIPVSGTTLNEKYGKLVPYPQTIDNIPYLNWWGLGLSIASVVDNGVVSTTNIYHDPTDIDVYIPIPFKIKRKSSSITTEEANKYSIIVEKTIDGIVYNLFYLKRIETISSEINYYKLTKDVVWSVEELFTSGYNPATQHIKSIPEKDNMSFVVANAKLKIALTKIEKSYIKEAIDLLYPDRAEEIKYNIGEICLYTGRPTPLGLAIPQASYFVNIDSQYNPLVVNDIDTAYDATIEIGNSTARGVS